MNRLREVISGTSFLKGPGIWLLGMMGWILPFALAGVFAGPWKTLWPSLVPCVVAGLTGILSAFVIQHLDARKQFWSDGDRCRKAVVLGVAYTITAGASLAVTIVLDAWGLVGYFGGDAAGSFGYLYIPSIVFYWLVAALVCGASRLRKPSTSHGSRN